MTHHLALHLKLPATQQGVFNPLLQRGVWLRAEIGCSVMSLLADQLGIAQDYVNERVTTLFLDGKAIDDLENAYVKDGSTLALSSAMPGLVGTTMRRGGHLAAMRGAITYHGQRPAHLAAGRVKLKLFNMLMLELAPSLLAYGVCLSPAGFSAFLAEQDEAFLQVAVLSAGDGQPLSSDQLQEHLAPLNAIDEILLRVEFSV